MGVTRVPNQDHGPLPHHRGHRSTHLRWPIKRPPITGFTREAAVAALRNGGFQALVRGFPEGAIVVFDHDLCYLCAGGHGLSAVGLTRAALIEGKTIFALFPPEVASLLEQPYRRALAGQEATIEIRLGNRTFSHRVAPLANDDGAIAAGIGFVLDVSEARNAEQALHQSDLRLRDARRRLRDAEAVGHSGSWEWDMVNNVISWSDGLFAMHGLDRIDFGGEYLEAASRVHPDDRKTVDDAMESCRRNEPVRFRYRVARASDGQMRWFDSRARGIFEEGKLVRLIGAVADITEQVVAEAGAIEANAFQQAIIAASPDYTYITDVATGALTYGSRDEDLLGRSSAERESPGPGGLDALAHPDDQAKLLAANVEASMLGDGEVLHLRYRLRHDDGQWHWFSRHIVPFRRDESGSVVAVLGVLRDITDIVRAEEQLAHDALHDELTGLANRALLVDRLEAALTRSRREGREIAVLFCDLDGFKHVNDTAGHAAGDAVLIATSNRLRGALRDGDTVARVGGDEFVLIIEPWNRADSHDALGLEKKVSDRRNFAQQVAQRAVRAIRKPIKVQGVDHEITISIGVTYPSLMARDGFVLTNASDALAEADAAMYAAKRNGKNRFEVFAELKDEPADRPR
jgi:diguanylate cyclase (GGDEF)-like protein/PAS domain S-box-containing protein